jgi:double-stranded uracil-DNA glycosylase
MARVHSFAPIATENAEVLVLGSMPGRASLAAGQYYAHPQNAFWRIVCALLDLEPASSYLRRIEALQSARIALWDVLHSCTREGSLDSMIELDTQIANDFRTFLRDHERIKRVFFNGAKAEACFKRHVLPKIESTAIDYLRLPSTSPANASVSFEKKLAAWRIVVPDRRVRRSILHGDKVQLAPHK